MLKKIKSIFGIGEKVIIDDGTIIQEGTIIRGEFYENGELKKGKMTFPPHSSLSALALLTKEKYVFSDCKVVKGEFYENGILKKGKIIFKDQTTRATVDSREVKIVGRVEKGE